MKRRTLLAVGMLPPPITGQALMFKRAIDALQLRYDLKVIDTQFQKTVGEAGLLSMRKVLHFFALLLGEITPLLSTEKFDVLYYCVAGPSTLGLIKDLIFLSMLRRRTRKTVYHLHGAGGITLLTQSNAFLRAWARFAMFRPDLVLRPPSSMDEAALCQARHARVITNGIEDPGEIIHDSMPAAMNAEPRFVFIGMITEDKGVFDLVEIARRLRDKGHRFTLDIVGQGLPAEVGRLTRLISENGLEEFVRLPGVLVGERKFELLRRATIFLFPTFFRAETQPTVIMEALAVGIPVVAYDWRGINTMVDQGVNGYLVPVRDTQAFCEAIEQVLQSGNAARMGEAGRRIYLERFTLDRHIEALRQAFKTVDPS